MTGIVIVAPDATAHHADQPLLECDAGLAGCPCHKYNRSWEHFKLGSQDKSVTVILGVSYMLFPLLPNQGVYPSCMHLRLYGIPHSIFWSSHASPAPGTSSLHYFVGNACEVASC